MISALYIEDELDYRLLVQRIVQKARWRVSFEETGEAGLKALGRRVPDVLILDVNLPDASGYALCRHIRQNPAWDELPILMLTVRRRPEEWLEGFASGATDYLSKPINPPQLVERVKACVDRARKARAKSAELALVQAGASGNPAAVDVLIQQHQQRLYEALRGWGRTRVEAEDIVSATFAKALEGLGRFHGRSAFYTWLYSIGMNELRQYCRRKTAVPLEALPDFAEPAVTREIPLSERVEEGLSQDDMQARMQGAVAALPRPYRTVVRWRFMRGLSYDTISRRLKIPQGTVMSRLFKAKEMLRKAWAEGERKSRVSY